MQILRKVIRASGRKVSDRCPETFCHDGIDDMIQGPVASAARDDVKIPSAFMDDVFRSKLGARNNRVDGHFTAVLCKIGDNREKLSPPAGFAGD